MPHWSSTARPRWAGASTARLQELPNINHRKEYEEGLDQPPDYRLTCFFIDRRLPAPGRVRARPARRLGPDRTGRRRRRRGVPAGHRGKKITASFLYNGTRSLFEQAGFTYLRPKGKNHCVMSTTVAPAVARVPG